MTPITISLDMYKFIENIFSVRLAVSVFRIGIEVQSYSPPLLLHTLVLDTGSYVCHRHQNT